MATRADATWTNTDKELWEEGDFFEAATFLLHVLQNIEFGAQSHDHSGDAGDGANLTDGNELLIWLYGPASGD